MLKDVLLGTKPPKVNCVKCKKLKDLIELNLIQGCYVCDDCCDRIDIDKSIKDKNK